jgi:hypothetical protein
VFLRRWRGQHISEHLGFAGSCRWLANCDRKELSRDIEELAQCRPVVGIVSKGLSGDLGAATWITGMCGSEFNLHSYSTHKAVVLISNHVTTTHGGSAPTPASTSSGKL